MTKKNIWNFFFILSIFIFDRFSKIAIIKSFENSNLESKDTAFFAVNDPNNDVNNEIKIDSITELFSEYFKSPNGLRSYLSGFSALRSIDSDNNLKINSDDLLWDDILLWFDNGDAISNPDEIYNVYDYIEEIDLKSYKLLDNQPDWNSGNQIIGNISVSPSNISEDIYQLYDVGLTINPSDNSFLDVEIESNNGGKDFVNIKENGENMEFFIRKDSIEPILKMQLVQDGRNDFRDFRCIKSFFRKLIRQY